MNNTLRYGGYLRKSTDSEDRQILSLDAQERELKEIAEKSSLNIVNLFRESMSAKAPGRPIFSDLMNQIKNGKIDALICWKPDRLARNLIDGGLVIDLLQRGVIKEIVTYSGRYLPTDNVLPLLIEFGMANQYIRDLSINVKRGNREKLSQGGWPGNAPFGYLNDKANKTIVVDPTKAQYVKRAFELYANEERSYEDVANALYAEGLRTKTGNKVFKASVQRIISSKFYTGLMERDGKLYQGVHEPIVSIDLYEKAQDRANNKSRPRPNKHTFALTGFLTCDKCGCALTASKQRGHDYYYCTNGKRVCDAHKSYMREVHLYEEVSKLLKRLAFSPRMINIMYRAALERSGKTVEYSQTVLDTLQKESDALVQRESRLFDIYLNGDIAKDIYDQKLNEMKNRKIEISNEITKRKASNPSVTLEQVKNVFEQGMTIRNKFLSADSEKKKEILKIVLSNISFKGKEIVTVQYKSPYHILANAPKNVSILTGLRCLVWYVPGKVS